MGSLEYWLDSIDDLVTRVDIDTGTGIGHSPRGGIGGL
jgi:hypothetical protein